MSWTTVSVGDAFDFVRNGKSVKQNKKVDGLPITRIETIADRTVDPARVGYAGLSEIGNEKWLLERGDILFSHINSVDHIGKCAIYEGVPEKLIHGMNLLALRPGKLLYPKFAYYALSHETFRVQLLPFVNKAVNQASVSTTNLKTLEIPLPSLNEQKRIAAILDQADQLRQKRRETIALLDGLTQAIFLEMFGDLGNGAQKWSRCLALCEVAEIGSGITKGRKTNSTSMIKVPYLAVANVQDKALNLDTIKSIEATAAEIEKYKLAANDLLLTEGGDPDKLGRGTLWREELPLAIHQNHIFRVRFTTPEIEPLYANWLIGSEYGKKYFLRSAKQTTGIASINKTQLSSFPVILPPIDLQRSFVRRAEAVSSQLSAHRAYLDSFDSAFFALQTSAFRGGIQ